MTNQITRRKFLGGLGATAVVAPMTPGAVAWFCKWFDSQKWWFYGKEPNDFNDHLLLAGNIHYKYEDGVFTRVERHDTATLSVIDRATGKRETTTVHNLDMQSYFESIPKLPPPPKGSIWRDVQLGTLGESKPAPTG